MQLEIVFIVHRIRADCTQTTKWLLLFSLVHLLLTTEKIYEVENKVFRKNISGNLRIAWLSQLCNRAESTTSAIKCVCSIYLCAYTSRVHTVQCNWIAFGFNAHTFYLNQLETELTKVLPYTFPMMIFDFIGFVRRIYRCGEKEKKRIRAHLFLSPSKPPLLVQIHSSFFILECTLYTQKGTLTEKKPLCCIVEVVQMYLSFLLDRSYRTRSNFLGRMLSFLVFLCFSVSLLWCAIIIQWLKENHTELFICYRFAVTAATARVN